MQVYLLSDVIILENFVVESLVTALVKAVPLCLIIQQISLKP